MLKKLIQISILMFLKSILMQPISLKKYLAQKLNLKKIQLVRFHYQPLLKVLMIYTQF